MVKELFYQKLKPWKHLQFNEIVVSKCVHCQEIYATVLGPECTPKLFIESIDLMEDAHLYVTYYKKLLVEFRAEIKRLARKKRNLNES